MSDPPPIVPGGSMPDPPPRVVYVQAPAGSNPTKAAGNTMVVLIVLLTVFCGLPILGCGAVLILEGLGYSIAGH